MKSLLVPALVILSAAGFAHQSGGASPESSVKKFISAFNAKNPEEAYKYVLPRKVHRDFAFTGQLMHQKPLGFVAIKSIHTTIKGTSAKISYKLELQSANSEPIDSQGTCQLTLVQDVWRIISEDPSSPVENGSRTSFLGTLAAYVIDPYSMAKYRDATRATESKSRIKQIAISSFVFLLDNDDVLKLKPETAKKALHPYLKDDNLWSYPGNTSGEPAYAFNKNLTNLKLDNIKRPNKVVLFYQGSAGRLKFINGKAAVAFANGDTKNITPDQEKDLIWKP